MNSLRTKPRMTAFLSSACLFVFFLAIIMVGSATLRAGGVEAMVPSVNQNPQGARVEPLAASVASTELAGGPVSVTLSPPPSQQGTNLVSRLNSLATGERIYLVLRDLATQQQPGVLYHVYLDLPAGNSAPAKDDPHFVGVVNFYNARAEGSPGFFRSFDVTDQLRNLQKQGLLSDQTTVTIIPSRGGVLNTSAKPVIGRIELVVQANPS
jgi:hypothetical protein